MNLSELLVDTKSAWVEYPGYADFEVEVANLSRPELTALRKRCVTSKINRSTRKPEEVLDEDKFLNEFSKATIKNWKGLKLDYLEQLLLVDISGRDPNETLEYSAENAKTLLANSSEFDTWVNETVFDLDNFRTKPARRDVEAPGSVAQ